MQGTLVRTLIKEDQATRSPRAPEPVLCNNGSHSSEKPMHPSQRGTPSLLQLEEKPAQQKTQHSQKLTHFWLRACPVNPRLPAALPRGIHHPNCHGKLAALSPPKSQPRESPGCCNGHRRFLVLQR
ncbi:unnamed protein product [Rangifer tarandus platyrhynchus]|uniref:Uncharacterized protein n=2 Tax=Rangifer tarandus platyrhynchus TaxID=3082113 RepID=A0AC59YKH1_RANTA|nr:unnamed protein product [Rangifer tarandus platyrhynchus]